MKSFEWDSEKASLNLDKHHVDFATASLIWDNPVFEKPDDRRDYGEARFVAFGEVEGRVLSVVYTWRGEIRRIISARKANRREQALFQNEIGNRGQPPPD